MLFDRCSKPKVAWACLGTMRKLLVSNRCFGSPFARFSGARTSTSSLHARFIMTRPIPQAKPCNHRVPVPQKKKNSHKYIQIGKLHDASWLVMGILKNQKVPNRGCGVSPPPPCCARLGLKHHDANGDHGPGVLGDLIFVQAFSSGRKAQAWSPKLAIEFHPELTDMRKIVLTECLQAGMCTRAKETQAGCKHLVSPRGHYDERCGAAGVPYFRQ